MSELIRHLKEDKYWLLFEAGEFNNALKFVYTALHTAANAGANKLFIKNNGFTWYKDDSYLGRYLGGDLPIPQPSYHDNLLKILERDNIVKTHIAIISENPEETVLSLDLNSTYLEKG